MQRRKFLRRQRVRIRRLTAPNGYERTANPTSQPVLRKQVSDIDASRTENPLKLCQAAVMIARYSNNPLRRHGLSGLRLRYDNGYRSRCRSWAWCSRRH